MGTPKLFDQETFESFIAASPAVIHAGGIPFPPSLSEIQQGARETGDKFRAKGVNPTLAEMAFGSLVRAQLSITDDQRTKMVDKSLELEAQLAPRGGLQRDKPSLGIDGKNFFNGGRPWFPSFASGFALTRRNYDERQRYLDSIEGTDGPRIMLGELGWASQTYESAFDALPIVLAELEDRNLSGILTVLTGTKDIRNIDHRFWLRRLRDMLVGRGSENQFLVEIANEHYHATQDDFVHDENYLYIIGREIFDYDFLWATSAKTIDEPQIIPGKIDEYYWPDPNGTWIPIHMRRGPVNPADPVTDIVRRLREQEMIKALSGKPVLNQEWTGAHETQFDHRRYNDPEIFAMQGSLERGFGLGGVFHSEDGLFARPLTQPIHAAGLGWYVSAKRMIERAAGVDQHTPLSFRNAGWAGGDVPVDSFSGLTRVYSFTADGNRYAEVRLGGSGTVSYKNGFRRTDTLYNGINLTISSTERT
jgi:hypothetical protein